MKRANFNEDLNKVLKSDSTIPMQKVVSDEKNKAKKEEPEEQAIKPKSEKQVSFEIEKQLLNQLKIRAIEEDLNFKGIMTAAIKKYLG